MDGQQSGIPGRRLTIATAAYWQPPGYEPIGWTPNSAIPVIKDTPDVIDFQLQFQTTDAKASVELLVRSLALPETNQGKETGQFASEVIFVW